MKYVAVAMALALAGCASKPETQAKIDSGAQIACVAMQAADAVFKTCATTPNFPEHQFCADHATEEAKVYAGVRAACTPPYTLAPDVLIAKAMKAAQDIGALTAAKP